MMKKIALIVPNNLWVCPYVSIYTDLFDKAGVPYEILSWNRSGKEEKGIQFTWEEKNRNPLEVFYAYNAFARFVKKKLKGGVFEKVVVFSPQLAIFLAGFLKEKYKDRYIIDYRDLSIEQKKPFGIIFRIVLRHSFSNVISSPGFLKYLPRDYEYIISHNFKIERVKSALYDTVDYPDKDTIDVLTIGAIREDRNRAVIDSLGNKKGFILHFFGNGPAAKPLEHYAREKGFSNVEFAGYYEKNDEPGIIKSCSLINIVYPLIPSHISALSNRFYNSLLFKRPMIVTKTTIQGDFAEKYDVGLVIENCDDLDKRIIRYVEELDFQSYVRRCNMLLREFVSENEQFESMLNAFIKDM